jgi:hypothetical protein
MSIYNSAKAGLAAIAPGGRILDSFAVIHNSANTVLLAIYYRNTAGATVRGLFQFGLVKGAGNTYTLTLMGADATGSFIYPGVKPLVDYFTASPFTVSWFADPSVSIYPRVKFTPQASPGTFFIARLLP